MLRKHFVLYQCLPVCPPRGNIVADTKFASWEAKMYPNKFRNIFVEETLFPILPTCFQMFRARETLFSRLGMLKQFFYGYVANLNDTVRKYFNTGAFFCGGGGCAPF